MTDTTRVRRCAKCGGRGHADHPTGVCSGLFDPYHTTGHPDWVWATPLTDRLDRPEFVKLHAPWEGQQ